jgi:hypothetical protein
MMNISYSCRSPDGATGRSCTDRQTKIVESAKNKGTNETLYHLRVQDANDSAFWLDLEVNSSATLSSLDKYLRAIWLECCGHMSQFSVGGWGGDAIGMIRKISNVFQYRISLDDSNVAPMTKNMSLYSDSIECLIITKRAMRLELTTFTMGR